MANTQNNNNFKVTIDGKDYTKNTVYPIKWSKLLDERLDETRLSLKRLDKNIIHPLTQLSVTMTDKRGKQITLDTVVTTDESAEVPVGNGTYNHEIMCLEETKRLEGVVVDALTFTNDLGRNYLNNITNAQLYYAVYEPRYDVWEKVRNIPNGEYEKGTTVGYDFGGIERVLPYENPQNGNNPIIIPAIQKQVLLTRVGGYEEGYTCPKLTVKPPSGNEISVNSYTEDITIEKPQNGTYEVYYDTYISNNSGAGAWQLFRFAYTFNVATNEEPLPRWNIASVIDRVLDLAETHLEGVEPRFKLNAAQRAEFEKIESPEFAFTNSTLKEILDQIGGYIHGVPRLKGNEIYFDMLGGVKQAKISDPKYPYVSNMYSQDIENYCTSLDSTVDNLVCLTDRAQGTVTEPWIGGSKTVRTDTVYARVSEDNMYIETKYPIQEFISLQCTAVPGMNLGSVDITPYVFESAEYNRMSGYSETYPSSKVYALYYTQGEKHIRGLNFRIPKASGATTDPAIVRILTAASGQSVPQLGQEYPALTFRVSYIPIFSARTQQTKQYIGEYKEPRTLVYNQGANVIETRHFGENLKGAVARMGNVDRVVTYNLGEFSLIPEIGDMYGDDYYISGVTCELYPTLIKCMLTLSQDFNRLSQYIGINSVRRFYEVSEKQAYNRDIKYADYVVIGDKVDEDETLTSSMAFLATQLSGNAFLSPISDPSFIYTPSSALIQEYDKDGNESGERIRLPIVSTAQGNAIVLTFSFEDNYSAGAQVQHEREGVITGYFTNAVPYGDYYGRIHSLKFQFLAYSSNSEDAALKLPQSESEFTNGSVLVHTGEHNLKVSKDGAEILSVNYVLEFVTNKKTYIIGSAFARNSLFVKYQTSLPRPALFVLPERINKFSDIVDLSNATQVWDFYQYTNIAHAVFTTKSIKLDDFTPTVNGQAWAVALPSGELLFGSNEPIVAGQAVSMPYLTLRHDIFNLGGK